MRWTLSYHDVLGGKKERFSLEQDAYHAAVKHLGLERGEIQREDIEIELGDELTVSALALSRGHNADGTPRPRRSMTPAEGRAAVKRLRRGAEIANKRAEEAWRQAEAERAAAISAHAEADRRTQESADLIRQANIEHELAAAARLEAQAQQDKMAAEQLLIDQEREQIEADRCMLENDRSEAALSRAAQDAALQLRAREVEAREREAADALVAAQAACDAAAAEATEARKVRADAEAERAKAGAERDAVAAERARLDYDEAQLALLARATDDDAGLRLCPTEKNFSMNERAMTEQEREAYTRQWSGPLLRIARQLARALEQVRRLIREVRGREKAVDVREAAVAAREQMAELGLAKERDAQRREHKAAMDELGRRNASLHAEERRVATLVADAEAKMAVTTAMQASAEAKEAAAEEQKAIAGTEISRIQRWLRVITAIDRDRDAVELSNTGELRLTLGASPEAATAIAAVAEDRSPSWARLIILQQLDLADSIKSASEHEREMAYAAERLTEMVEKAGPVLTPAQQSTAAEVTRLTRKYDPAQRIDPGSRDM